MQEIVLFVLFRRSVPNYTERWFTAVVAIGDKVVYSKNGKKYTYRSPGLVIFMVRINVRIMVRVVYCDFLICGLVFQPAAAYSN